MRIKYCEICQNDFPVMYRIQYSQSKNWVFTCEQCLLLVKKDNPHYRYGGTWKR